SNTSLMGWGWRLSCAAKGGSYLLARRQRETAAVPRLEAAENVVESIGVSRDGRAQTHCQNGEMACCVLHHAKPRSAGVDDGATQCGCAFPGGTRAHTCRAEVRVRMTKLYAVWMLVVAITLCALSASAQTPANSSADKSSADKSEKPTNPAPKSAKPPAKAGASAGKSSGTPAASNGSKGKGSTPAGGADAPAPEERSSKPSAPASGAATAAGKSAQTTPAAAPRGDPASSAAAKDTAAKDTAASYVVRLRDLESRVDELKEQIRRSHTRLALLSESVLSAGVGGAQAQVVFRNAMSNAFRVEEVMVVLDGAVQYNEKGDEAPDRKSTRLNSSHVK